MYKVKIVDDSFSWNDNIQAKCYRVIAEEHGVRSFSFLTKFIDIAFWRKKVFCGLNSFYYVSEKETSSHFIYKYENYFSDRYKLGLMNPNNELSIVIEDFNAAIKKNVFLSRYNKTLKHVPKFTIQKLIDNSDIVFAMEYYSGDNGDSLIFFESKNIDSKKYIIDYFQTYNVKVIDTTISR